MDHGLCEHVMNELKLMMYSLVDKFKKWNNPPCKTCGYKKS